jgi:hypothetical protein
MSIRTDGQLIYHRSKLRDTGAIILGAFLLALAAVVLTRDEVAGIRFSPDLVAMTRWLALPVGVALLLGHISHFVARGPTLVADGDGLTILFTRRPVGVIRWTDINGFTSFRHQGRPVLGITLEDPKRVLAPFRDDLHVLVRRAGPRAAHVSIDGNMLDDPMKTVLHDLEEMRRVYSWRADLSRD